MINKIKNLKNSKKAVAFIACAALTVTIGAGTVLASSANKAEATVNNAKAGTEKVELVKGAVLSDDKDLRIEVKEDENGKLTYSTDGGKTWTDEKPEGLDFEFNDSLPNIMVKEENGVVNYSTDEGKTWSDKLPEGVDMEIRSGEVNGAEEGESLSVKNEDGKISHSKDNGKTWIDGAPEGVEFNTNEEK